MPHFISGHFYFAHANITKSRLQTTKKGRQQSPIDLEIMSSVFRSVRRTCQKGVSNTSVVLEAAFVPPQHFFTEEQET